MKKMSTIKKIILAIVAVLLAVLIGYFAYVLIHFRLYDEYKNFLNEKDEYETGTPFAALKDSGVTIDGMSLASENDILKLYIDTKTAEVAVLDKRNGEITYSNPVHADDDAIASKSNKSYLKSQLIIEYFNYNRKSSIFDSYEYSTSRGQFEIETIKDGVRVVYTLGDLENAMGIVPEYITSERLESILAGASEEDAKYVRLRYTEERSDKKGFLQILPSVKDGIATLNRMNKVFESAGYTYEEYLEDMAAADAEDAIPISFVVPLEYRLQDDGMSASIDPEQIVENAGATIYRIQLLRFFGAADMNESGYMMVPNGSGSIIYFNNGKTEAQRYTQYVYGIDPLAADFVVLENTEPIRLPVFGLNYSNRKTGIFATIEKGDSHAIISADVSGSLNTYNSVYPTFVMRGYDKLAMFGVEGNMAELPVVEKNIYHTPIEVRYTFLTEEHQGYSGMANYYRNRLVDEGVLTKNEEKDSIPFYMDLIGGVKRTAFFLGAQYRQVFPMTTFDEAGLIVDELSEAGVNHIVVNYQGWFNGGYYHEVPSKVKLEKKLGSKKELEQLSSKVEELGGKVYGDVAFQKVTWIAKKYDYKRESSRYYGGGYVASFGLVNPTTMRQTSGLSYTENLYNLVSPKFLVRYIDRFSSKINKYDLTGISLRDLGDVLQSDKKKTGVILREEAKEVVVNQFEILEQTGKDIMLSGGNSYALQFADDIINVPLNSNSYLIIDEDIPFYEMLIHGYIDYAGISANLDDSFDEVDSILRLIETGAAPHFTFTYKNSSEIKYTGLKQFYSTTFDTWSSTAKEMYADVNEALKYVTNAEIVHHENITKNMSKVTYSNGVVFYVNKGNDSVEVDGFTIPAKSYRMEGR